MTPAERRALRAAVLEEAAVLLESRFGERLQRRQATNALRSAKERDA